MNDKSTSDPSAHNDSPTAMEQAVRARALERIRQEHEQPKPTWQRRVAVIGLTALAVLVVFTLLNFAVTGLMRIMDIWYPGSISGRNPEAPRARSLDEPFMVGVVTEDESNSSASSSVSSANKIK
jgi:hypothetical protein